jgi:predicted cobalt transporter CbtA
MGLGCPSPGLGARWAGGPSSLAVSLSSAVELLEGCIDAIATNGVCWGTRSVLVAALSYFLELGPELELLGSRRNADLTEDQVDAFWTQAHPASDSLPLYVLSLVARDSFDGAGVE